MHFSWRRAIKRQWLCTVLCGVADGMLVVALGGGITQAHVSNLLENGDLAYFL